MPRLSSGPRPIRRASASCTRHGFTLIEILVVTLIIGTLMGIAIPLYLSSVRHASAQAIKANLRMIGQAGQVYYVKNGRYPSSLGDIVGPGRDIENVAGPVTSVKRL